MPHNHLILVLLLLPSIFASIKVFSNELALHIRWPKYWSFSFSISPSNEFQDWNPCCPRDSQESSSTPQFKSINSSALRFLYNSALTSIRDYWKKPKLFRMIFVGKVMSLLFNMLSRLVIIFLPKSKRLLISWRWSPSAVILEPPKIKSLTVSIVSHLFAMTWWDRMPWS